VVEESIASGDKRVVCQLKTTPFHVQSRPNKRKCSVEKEASLMKKSRSLDSLRASAMFVEGSGGKQSSASDDDDSADGLMIEDTNSPSLSTSASVKEKTSSDSHYIDITELLILPQKEAARQLGISESMLCKRFKECTRRKWPYRYLRKIDKVINMLNLHKVDGAIPKEDRDKLEKLTQERDACLTPVKIRITACDKLSAFRSSSGSFDTSPLSPSSTISEENVPDSPVDSDGEENENDHEEEEIPEDILETLKMMRRAAPKD